MVCAAAGGPVTGNRCLADQWRDVLVGLGHVVAVTSRFDGQKADLLVALHASKCAADVAAFRANQSVPVVLILTGTDIYPAPEVPALDTMATADRLIALQPRAVSQVPDAFHHKIRVIRQAALPSGVVAHKSGTTFDIAVVANLRDVKDPLLTAAAARLLHPASKLRIRHAGTILEDKYRALAESESAENPRYQWVGQLDPTAAHQLIADSDLLVLSSLSEGAGRVVGEAIVEGTPILSTRVDGVVGLVGEDYPGLFPVGDAPALAKLLNRCETDASFMEELRCRCGALAPQFAPERERAAWRDLLDDLAMEQ